MHEIWWKVFIIWCIICRSQVSPNSGSGEISQSPISASMCGDQQQYSEEWEEEEEGPGELSADNKEYYDKLMVSRSMFKIWLERIITLSNLKGFTFGELKGHCFVVDKDEGQGDISTIWLKC